MKNFKINQIIEGRYSHISWKDVSDFSILTGDRNPLHVSRIYCKTTPFKKPIAHGLLGLSLVVALLGNSFKGIILKTLTIDFTKPIFINTKVKPLIECIEIKDVHGSYKNQEILFNIKLVDKDNHVYLKGKALMFIWGEKI